MLYGLKLAYLHEYKMSKVEKRIWRWIGGEDRELEMNAVVVLLINVK